MFEYFVELYAKNSDFINGAASVASLVASLFAVNSFRKARQKKVFYQWKRIPKVISALPDGHEINITCENKSGESLTLDIVSISNRTDVTLTDADFVRPITIEADPERTIYKLEVVSASGDSNAKATYNDGSITISEMEVPRGSSITFYITHDNAIRKKLVSTTKSLPDLALREFKKPHEYMLSETLAMLFVVVIMFTALEQVKQSTEGISVGVAAFFVVGTVLAGMIAFATESSSSFISKRIGWLLRPILGSTKDESILSSTSVEREIEQLIRSRTK